MISPCSTPKPCVHRDATRDDSLFSSQNQGCHRPSCHTAGTDMDAGLIAVLQQEEKGPAVDLLPQVQCAVVDVVTLPRPYNK